jgi:hypothetical protein
MPGRHTPPQARNFIRKSLQALADRHPSPSEIDELWRFFANECAYCGTHIERDSRRGHIDHLVPAAQGGGNGVTNRILSCATCNGDERRDRDWMEFLKAKAGAIYDERKRRIVEWAQTPRAARSDYDKELLEKVTKEALEAYDRAVDELRKARFGTGPLR